MYSPAFARFGEHGPKCAEHRRIHHLIMCPMNASRSRVLLTTDGFAARVELTTHAETKAAKLFRHSHPQVHFVRINLKRTVPHSGAPFFAARASAEHEGRDHISHAKGAEPETALNEGVDKLERALSGTAGKRKHGLHREAALSAEPGLAE